MPNFRRYYLPNSIIFITNVTKNRQPIFASDPNIEIYNQTLKILKALYSFQILAYVILHDHFHWLIHIKDGKGDFSKILQSFKRGFTKNYKEQFGIKQPCSIWQARFWDHIIRNEKDLERHFDYIHWNPVKHGYVNEPQEWIHSSYKYWHGRDYYPVDWGKSNPDSIAGMNFE